MKPKKLSINKIMDIENKIIRRMGYSSGGYYKDQIENKNIYLAVKKAMMKLDLSSFSRRDYNYLENENYHSLNAVIQDIKKELKFEKEFKEYINLKEDKKIK
jgi:hypothetical protein